jgi:hypothetical protein
VDGDDVKYGTKAAGGWLWWASCFGQAPPGFSINRHARNRDVLVSSVSRSLVQSLNQRLTFANLLVADGVKSVCADWRGEVHEKGRGRSKSVRDMEYLSLGSTFECRTGKVEPWVRRYEVGVVRITKAARDGGRSWAELGGAERIFTTGRGNEGT